MESAPPLFSAADVAFMRRALQLAEQAAAVGEVPVGAVLVQGREVLGEGFNQPIGSQDPTAHAEIVALRAAARRVGNYRLPDTTLYVTLEPCTMCIGALMHARVARLVFAAREPRAGAVVSTQQLCEQGSFNHRLAWQEGALAADSAALLTAFFRARR
jgi:tRNA(adenine34) deaminase